MSNAELVAMMLADGRLPTGGHTQSAGLEPAVRAGLGADGKQLADVAAYARDRLRTVTRVEAAVAVVTRHLTLQAAAAGRASAATTIPANTTTVDSPSRALWSSPTSPSREPWLENSSHTSRLDDHRPAEDPSRTGSAPSRVEWLGPGSSSRGLRLEKPPYDDWNPRLGGRTGEAREPQSGGGAGLGDRGDTTAQAGATSRVDAITRTGATSRANTTTPAEAAHQAEATTRTRATGQTDTTSPGATGRANTTTPAEAAHQAEATTRARATGQTDTTSPGATGRANTTTPAEAAHQAEATTRTAATGGAEATTQAGATGQIDTTTPAEVAHQAEATGRREVTGLGEVGFGEWVVRVEQAWGARVPSQVVRGVSRRQGRLLLRLARRVWPGVSAYMPEDGEIARPVVLGVVAAVTGLSAEQVVRIVAYDDAQTVISASLKLLPVDPADAATWLAGLTDDIERLVKDVAPLTALDSIPADGAPLIDVFAHNHALERMRLFHA